MDVSYGCNYGSCAATFSEAIYNGCSGWRCVPNSNCKRPAWWQAADGNVHADGGNLTSTIPETAAHPYLIRGATGLASYAGTADLGHGTVNEDGSQWLAQTTYKGVKTGYAYFQRILADDPAAAKTWDGSQPAEGNGVYAETGDMATSGAWHVGSGDKLVILADGRVEITEMGELAMQAGENEHQPSGRFEA